MFILKALYAYRMTDHASPNAPLDPYDVSPIPEMIELSTQPPQPPAASQERLEDIADIDESRLYAMLSYVSVLVLVPWLTHKDDPYVNYHLRQGIVVCTATILTLVLTAWAPRIGSLLFLLLLITSVVGIVMALSGRQWQIPIIGRLASLLKL